MNQSKLTYQEIIDKLQELQISVETFAHDEDLPYEITEEDKQATEKRKEYITLNPPPIYDGNINSDYQKYQRHLRENYPTEWDFARKRWMQENNIVWEEIHQQGGEGEGDHWESVKYFPDHDVYIKVTGYYQSYDGTEFYGGYKDCCSEVRPKEKTITVYE